MRVPLMMPQSFDECGISETHHSLVAIPSFSLLLHVTTDPILSSPSPSHDRLTTGGRGPRESVPLSPQKKEKEPPETLSSLIRSRDKSQNIPVYNLHSHSSLTRTGVRTPALVSTPCMSLSLSPAASPVPFITCSHRECEAFT